MKKDIYAEITNAIIEELEKGQIPWAKPWVTTYDNGNVARSYTTGKAYSLLNQMLLRKPGEYITFNQCKEKGGHVKKGAKAKMVVFWKMLSCEKRDEQGNTLTDENGETIRELRPFLRYYQVFHINDCEGIEPKYTTKSSEPLPGTTLQPIEKAEKVLTDYINRESITLEIEEDTDDAYYSPAKDLIHLPALTQYTNANEFYSTAFHEVTHSTGHPARLNRLATGAQAAFGGTEYSKEELTAELGSCCVLASLGIDTMTTFRNSAAYIQSWLKALRNDKKMIVGASARAEKAVRFILGEPETMDEGGEEENA